MRKLVEYEIAEGESIWIEIDDIEPSGFHDFSIGSRKKQHLEEVLAIIRPFAGLIFKKLNDLDPAPSEIEVEFGVKLNTKVGAILACASAEANYNINLKWVNINDRK